VAKILEFSRQASRTCSRVEDPDYEAMQIQSLANVDIRVRVWTKILETDPYNGEICPEGRRMRESQSSPVERMILTKTWVSCGAGTGM
jgi:hypothetical protein